MKVMHSGWVGIIRAVALVGATTGAVAQEADPPGTGILCGYDILAAVLVDAEVCGWIDTERGRAVRQVFTDTGAFIAANDTDYPERVACKEAGVAGALELLSSLDEAKKKAFCTGTDPERPNYFISMRAIEPEVWLKGSKETLSIPAKPTYGVCF